MKIENLKLKKLALRLSKGFTMIELLIVISVLGILAVAVLAAINPIEQINRGKDTGSRSDAEQLLSAIDRFYTQGYYPWQTGADDTDDLVVTPITKLIAVDTVKDDNNVGLLTKLSSGGTAEIKTAFTARIVKSDYNYLWLYNRGTQGDSTYVCFYPKSGSFNEEAKTRCGVDGAGLPTDLQSQSGFVCKGGTGVDAWMICLP